MLSETIQSALNTQIRIEAESSQVYLAMAVWAEVKGLEGISNFMYDQSDEEREHMLKFVKFVNERGGHAIFLNSMRQMLFSSFKEMFEKLLEHEILFLKVSMNWFTFITRKRLCYA